MELVQRIDGVREGVSFINEAIIPVTDRAFDDFADTDIGQAANQRMLGIV